MPSLDDGPTRLPNSIGTYLPIQKRGGKSLPRRDRSDEGDEKGNMDHLTQLYNNTPSLHGGDCGKDLLKRFKE